MSSYAASDLSGAQVSRIDGGAAAIAQVVVSLVESDFVTGETVRVDGGRHLK